MGEVTDWRGSLDRVGPALLLEGGACSADDGDEVCASANDGATELEAVELESTDADDEEGRTMSATASLPLLCRRLPSRGDDLDRVRPLLLLLLLLP